MKRRNLLLGLGGLAGASGAVGTGAFSSITANRDVTVSVADDTDAYLALRPSGGPNSAYVKDISENNGLLALDFAETDAGGTGLGTDSVYTFDNVFTITNQGTQPVYVWGTFDGGSEDFTAGGEDTDIWLYPDGDSETKLRDNGDGVVRLGVGEPVHVGVYVDTHDVNRDQKLAMTINATVEKPDGAPGSATPPAPITVNADGQTRYFQTLPTALEYASGKSGIIVEMSPRTYPQNRYAITFTDRTQGRKVEYSVDRTHQLRFTGATDVGGYSITIQPDEDDQTGWIATVQDPGSAEDQNTIDLGLQMGLSQLLATASTDGKSLSFGESGSVTYPGTGGEDEPFVFTRGDNETLSFVPSADGTGIERLTLTTADGSLSFTQPDALGRGPELLAPTPEPLTLEVPGAAELKGVGGRAAVDHSITIETDATSDLVALRRLDFGEPPSNFPSVTMGTGGTGPLSNLELTNVEFKSDFFTSGLRLENDVDGLMVRSCSFVDRRRGIQAFNAQLSGLQVADTTFCGTGTGINAGDVREGYIHGETKFDGEGRSTSKAVDIEDPTGLGIDDITIKNQGTGIKFQGDFAAIDEGRPLADQIESDVPDSDPNEIGVSGIVNSTFKNNNRNVKNESGESDFPVANCSFKPGNDRDDIETF